MSHPGRVGEVSSIYGDDEGDTDLEVPDTREHKVASGRLLDGPGDDIGVVVGIEGAQEDDDGDH